MWLQMFSYAISYYKYVQQLLLKPPWSNTVMEKWRVYLNLTIQKMLTTSTLHFQNLVPNLRSLESKFSQNDSKVEHSPFQHDLCRELSIWIQHHIAFASTALHIQQTTTSHIASALHNDQLTEKEKPPPQKLRTSWETTASKTKTKILPVRRWHVCFLGWPHQNLGCRSQIDRIGCRASRSGPTGSRSTSASRRASPRRRTRRWLHFGCSSSGTWFVSVIRSAHAKLWPS